MAVWDELPGYLDWGYKQEVARNQQLLKVQQQEQAMGLPVTMYGPIKRDEETGLPIPDDWRTQLMQLTFENTGMMPGAAQMIPGITMQQSTDPNQGPVTSLLSGNPFAGIPMPSDSGGQIDQLAMNIPGYHAAAGLANMWSPNLLSPTLVNESSLKQTPGYQFLVDQGNAGINATAAAGGMLGSGNALAAAAHYNQGLAMQAYQYTQDLANTQYQFQQNLGFQNYMGNAQIMQQGYNAYMQGLSGIAQTGVNATNSQAGMDVAQGLGTSALTDKLGSSGLSTKIGQGEALFQSATNQGNMLNKTDMFNAGENNDIMAEIIRAGSKGGGGGGATGGSTAASRQASGFAQGMLGGSGQGGGSGKPSYSDAFGNTFTNWSV